MELSSLPYWMCVILMALIPLSASKVGLIAVVNHGLGYSMYISKSLGTEINPNPLTWGMFTYSTLITTWFEYQLGASGHLLYLPIVCSIGSVVVAVICIFKGTMRWPENKEDRYAFLMDVFLMCCAIIAYALYRGDWISETSKYYAMAALLVFSNWSTFYAFRPILREAREDPGHDRPSPWIIWTIAYVWLGASTVMDWIEHGDTDHFMFALLMLYPVSCAYLHGKMAWYAWRCKKRSVLIAPTQLSTASL